MNKKTFITMMLALVAMTGQAQEIKMKTRQQSTTTSRCLIKKAIRLTALMSVR